MSVTNIQNDNDLRIAYWMINIYQKYGKPDETTVLKKAVRKYHHSQQNEPERYFDCNSDTYRVFSVTPYSSVADAEEQHVPLTCYPDQIGRHYEISHKFFKRSDGKVCGYAFVGMNW